MPEPIHKPVMMAEALEAITPRPGGRFVDGTLGRAGHAAAILAASSPTGWLYGCDRDGDALEAARRRLAGFAGRFDLRQGNFADLAAWVPPSSCDAVLLDLGLSSPQLETAARGFSFQLDGPLDMRFDPRQPLTAGELVNTAGVDELAGIFRDLGGERDARRLARAVAKARERRRFETTRQLADLIEQLSPRRGKKTHPATRIFQALRMAANDEVGSLKRGLVGALSVLKPGGRLVVLTYHSVDDAIVKAFGRERARDYSFSGTVDVPELRQPRVPEIRLVTRKALKPGAAELAENPRSRSAQLRVMEKT